MNQKSFPTIIYLLIAVLFAAYQDVHSQIAASKSSQNDPFSWEIKPGDINPEFLRKWDYEPNSSLQRQQENNPRQKLIRIVYLVPSDKALRNDYQAAIADAIIHLQGFYQNELGNGNRFSLHTPIVEVYQTSHTASYYSTHPNGPSSLWFWQNALDDGFALSGGSFNDPYNRWVYYIDADPACGQSIGGNAGVALLSANDFRGLVGEQNIPRCSNESPDNGGQFRWIGGLGHELAHTFNVPHPPGCGGPGPNSGCTGGSFAANSIMWLGFRSYPNTYFLADDKQILLNSGFFSNAVIVSGQVLRADGRGVFNARVTITDQNGVVRYAISNPFGYYRFINVTGGQTYTIRAEHKRHQFASRLITPNDNLTGVDFVSQ